MSPTVKAPGMKNNDSLLPSHTSRPTQAVVIQPAPNLDENLKEYNIADAKLLKLEEELDFLFHFAGLLREQRTEIALGHLNYLDEKITGPEGDDQLIDRYLELAAKGKSVDDMINTLKEECAASRSECDHLLSQIHAPTGKRHQKLLERKGLANGHPESGFVDRDALADRIILAESTATNVAGVVGAFGAGITYTTLFSASRGRLDLISWAFTSFLIVVIDCTALQVFSLPRQGQLARLFRPNYRGSVEKRILIYTVLVGIPLVAGFILLGVSVATLTNGVPVAALNSPEGRIPVTGSQMAIKASGYLPVAILGYFVVIIIVALGVIAIMSLLPRSVYPKPKDLQGGDTRLPAALVLQEKLHFLPGGPGYIQYRQRHLELTKTT